MVLPWLNALKQAFDLEFLALDPGGFIPVYFSEMNIYPPIESARFLCVFAIARVHKTLRKRAISRIPDPVAKVSMFEISPRISKRICWRYFGTK